MTSVQNGARILHVDAPNTYPVKANTQVNPGQLLEIVTGGVVQPASANSTTCVGVCQVIALGTDPASGQTTSYGAPVIDFNPGGAYSGYTTAEPGVYNVTYAGAVVVGAKLKAAANGQVVTWVSGTDAADRIVGVCVEPAGVAGAATVGRARIF